MRERTLGAEHGSTLHAVINLGAVLQVEGKEAEAEQLYRRAEDGLLKTVGADDPATLSTQFNLGNLAEHRGQWSEADGYYSEVLRRQRRVLGADHADTLSTSIALAVVRRRQYRYDEAETLTREAVTRARRALPHPHPVTADALVSLGTVLNAGRRFVEARPVLEEGLEMRRLVKPGHWHVASAQAELGVTLVGLRLYSAAEPMPVEGCLGILGSSEPSDVDKRSAVEQVVGLYEARGKPDKAAEWRKKLPPRSNDPQPFQ